MESLAEEDDGLYSDNSDDGADFIVHDYAAADRVTGRMVYLEACDSNHMRPISNIVDKISDCAVNVVRLLSHTARDHDIATTTTLITIVPCCMLRTYHRGTMVCQDQWRQQLLTCSR